MLPPPLRHSQLKIDPLPPHYCIALIYTVDLHYTVFVNSPTPLNLFVIPESILAALSRSFSDVYRVAKISVT